MKDRCNIKQYNLQLVTFVSYASKKQINNITIINAFFILLKFVSFLEYEKKKTNTFQSKKKLSSKKSSYNSKRTTPNHYHDFPKTTLQIQKNLPTNPNRTQKLQNSFHPPNNPRYETAPFSRRLHIPDAFICSGGSFEYLIASCRLGVHSTTDNCVCAPSALDARFMRGSLCAVFVVRSVFVRWVVSIWKVF